MAQQRNLNITPGAVHDEPAAGKSYIVMMRFQGLHGEITSPDFVCRHVCNLYSSKCELDDLGRILEVALPLLLLQGFKFCIPMNRPRECR